jgi:hypothetical protein
MLTPPRSLGTATLLGTPLLATALLIALPAAALADPCHGGHGTIGCGVGGGGGTGGGGGSGGGSGRGGGGDDTDNWEPMPEINENPNDLTPGTSEEEGGGPGEPAPMPTIALAMMARARTRLPVPMVVTEPGTKTYVRLRTVLRAENYRPVGVTVADPTPGADQTVQITATPSSVVWNLGETTKTCAGPECSYVYKRSSAGQPGNRYSITATIWFDVAWTCEGDDCEDDGGVLDPMPSTSVAESLIVGEIQTNNRP